MPPPWRCTATASSPRSSAAWRSPPPAGPAAGSCPSSRRPGALVSLLVWLMFGVIAVVPALESLTWQIAVYAVLSLTRHPDAAGGGGPAGHRARPCQPSLFVGWFGPRGLASVVFGLLALEALGRAGGQACRHRHRVHRAAQRGRPRADRRAAGQALRRPARPGGAQRWRRAGWCRSLYAGWSGVRTPPGTPGRAAGATETGAASDHRPGPVRGGPDPSTTVRPGSYPSQDRYRIHRRPSPGRQPQRRDDARNDHRPASSHNGTSSSNSR